MNKKLNKKEKKRNFFDINNIIFNYYNFLFSFRKKVMDNWLEKRDAVMKIAKQSRLQHQPIFNLLNCNDSMNHNNGIIKQTRWDCSSHVSNLDQSK